MQIERTRNQFNIFDFLQVEEKEPKSLFIYSNGRYWTGSEYTVLSKEAKVYTEDTLPKELPAGMYEGNEVMTIDAEMAISKDRQVALQKDGMFYSISKNVVERITDATYYDREKDYTFINEMKKDGYYPVDVRSYIADNSKLIVLVYFGTEMHSKPEYKSYVLKELVDRPWLCGTWYGPVNDSTIAGQVINDQLEFRWRRHDMKEVLLREKLNKGYYIRKVIWNNDSEDSIIKIENKDVKVKQSKCPMVNELIAISKGAFTSTSSDKVNLLTDDIVEKCQSVIDEMSTIKDDVKVFNDKVAMLYMLILRNVDSVNDAFANTTDDFMKIISREQAFLDNVVSLMKLDKVETKTTDDVEHDIMDDLDVHFDKVVDNDEIDKIKKLLGSNANQYDVAYRVINKATQKKFDEYVKKNKSNIVELFHGSQSQNWWSICTTGLKIRPANVATCGSMFGIGIYLADEADKSINYTSMQTYHNWRDGSNYNFGYLGIYRTAQTKAYDIYDWNSDMSSLDSKGMKKRGTDYVFAHKSKGMLYRNEFVFYNSDQVDIEYIVKIKQ